MLNTDLVQSKHNVFLRMDVDKGKKQYKHQELDLGDPTKLMINKKIYKIIIVNIK